MKGHHTQSREDTANVETDQAKQGQTKCFICYGNSNESHLCIVCSICACILGCAWLLFFSVDHVIINRKILDFAQVTSPLLHAPFPLTIED